MSRKRQLRIRDGKRVPRPTWKYVPCYNLLGTFPADTESVEVGGVRFTRGDFKTPEEVAPWNLYCSSRKVQDPPGSRSARRAENKRIRAKLRAKPGEPLDVTVLVKRDPRRHIEEEPRWIATHKVAALSLADYCKEIERLTFATKTPARE